MGETVELGIALEEPATVTFYTKTPVTSITLDGEAIPFTSSDEGAPLL